jgi:carbamoyl-phosphate synthase large subunit
VHAVHTFRELGYEAVMVNCNPETVSTDYDTSDRLYFEPLDAESVLAICDRERPEGVVIQFGGQTPLKLARAIEEAGYRILGTPYDAVDLAEDRERFAGLLRAHDIASPGWGIASSSEEAARVAHEVGFPVLVRPSYVLGGRAMRICFNEDEVRAVPVVGRVLVDRFLESAVEVDVDALCDGADTYVAAVMQHVEEAGVHSGDSTCVLPAPWLTPAQTQEINRIVRVLGRSLGVVGLLNVQLALTPEGEVCVIEANPRASRTVPFVSKSTGVQLVAAACRLAAGARLAELGLPAERPPKQWSVKAAVLPFHRFPGSDPVLSPEMRSTGEVMASAGDLPTALAKAERAAGRALPTSGAVFLSIRPEEQKSAVPIAATLVGLGFKLFATEGTAATLAAARIEVEAVRKVSDAVGDEPSVLDLIRRGRCDLVINTPQGRNARSDGYLIREAALSRRVPCITTMAGAAAAVHAIANARAEQAVSLQERIDAETRTA